MSTWTLSDQELLTLIQALQSDSDEIERGGDVAPTEKQQLISERHELAGRLKSIRDALRKDVDPDGMGSERDQVVLRIVPKPGDETYMVVPWNDKWAIVEKANPDRPVGEHIYTQKTHVHRTKRALNLRQHARQWLV